MSVMAALGVVGHYSDEGEENLDAQWLEWEQSLPQALRESPDDKLKNIIFLFLFRNLWICMTSKPAVDVKMA